jgi:dipeptide/tripeptide permease
LQVTLFTLALSREWPFAVAGASAWGQYHGKPASWGWAVAFIVVMTAGELCILPVGLGLFARLAPPGLTATTVAIWYFAGFAGNLLAGWLGSWWNGLSHGLFLAMIGGVALLSAACLAVLMGKASARSEIAWTRWSDCSCSGGTHSNFTAAANTAQPGQGRQCCDHDQRCGGSV